jgi:hypothetical protein
MLSPPADNDDNGWQPRARTRAVPFLVETFWSPNGVQTAKKPPVASTGVQTALR